MTQYVESDLLKDTNLNITRRKAKKETILLFDTQRRLDDYLAKLKYRTNGQYEDIPHFIITKSGEVIKVFVSNYSSKTFNKSCNRKFGVVNQKHNNGCFT